MNARNEKILDTIITATAQNTPYTFDEIVECLSCDVIARQIDFGTDPDEPISCENENGNLDFTIELDEILPFCDSPIDINIFENDGHLHISIPVCCEGDPQAKDRAVEEYMSQSKFAKTVNIENDYDVLLFHTECPVDNLEKLSERISEWFNILIDNEEFVAFASELISM